MQEAMANLKENKSNISNIKKYYGSKNWFKDKEYYENNKIEKIKAGALSEDTIWNMLEELSEITKEMKILAKDIDKIIKD